MTDQHAQAPLITVDQHGKVLGISDHSSQDDSAMWIHRYRCHDVLEGKIPLQSVFDAWPPGGIMGYPNTVAMGYRIDHHMWKSILDRVDEDLLRRVSLAIWDWRPTGHLLERKLPWARLDDWIAAADKRAFIIDGHVECMNPDAHMGKLLQMLRDRGLGQNEIIHLSANQTDSPYLTKIVSRWALCHVGLTHRDPDPQTDSHFAMLIRVPRELRVVAAVEVLDRGLENRGIMSCGVHDASDTEWIDSLVPQAHRHRFPMVIERDALDCEQFLETTTAVARCAINVICETSQDKAWAGRWWFDVYLTEKTERALMLCQLPIWITVPGTVADVRGLGFDVFDDVIDHSYDAMQDPQIRVKMAIDQLARLCAMPIQELDGLRQRLWPRLLRNRQKLHGLRDGFHAGVAKELSDHLERMV